MGARLRDAAHDRLAVVGRWRFLMALAVVAGMLVVGSRLQRTDVIFPEAGALAFGVLVLRIPSWAVSRRRSRPWA